MTRAAKSSKILQKKKKNARTKFWLYLTDSPVKTMFGKLQGA